jgi:hypothetical protein
VKLERVLNDLSPFVEEIRIEVADQMFVEGVSDLGLAEAVRKILASSKGVFRTARGIRASLETSGYDLGQHNNALASIHGVLKRLVDSGEAEPVGTEGKTRYRWKGSTAPTREDVLARLGPPKRRKSSKPYIHGRYRKQNTPRYKCPQCKKTFSPRTLKPCADLNISTDTIYRILTCLTEGTGIRATTKIQRKIDPDRAHKDASARSFGPGLFSAQGLPCRRRCGASVCLQLPDGS